MNNLPIDELKSLLTYNPTSGDIRWLPRLQYRFATFRAYKTWNTKFAYKLAGYLNSDGYIDIRIESKLYQAHRCAVALHTGEWPTTGVDHWNGVNNDNRWDNLRVVSQTVNSRNAKISKRNTTGVVGVYKYPYGAGKYTAQILKQHLGVFDSLAEATAARRDAANALGCTPHHGLSAEKRAKS